MAASSALALAAGKPPTYQNLFGLPAGPMTPDGGPLSQPQPPRQPQTQNAPTQTAAIPIPTTPATTPGAAGAPTPTVNTTFNLQTDPALQQVNALAGLSDEQANAQALKMRQQQLIQYGDPTLAAAVLGQNDPTVQAAGQNQESDLAMLGRERDQNLHQFENQLDPSLAFSGYRVGQEHLLGQAFQDALAKAAAGVNGNLDSITGNLNAALAGNNTNRINALGTAEANQIALALAGGGTPPPVSGGTTSSGGGNSTLALPIAPPQTNPGEPPLMNIASSLYGDAGGDTGGNAPIISGDQGSQATINPDLLQIAASLYKGAGGATGNNKPITSVTRSRPFRPA